MAITTPRLSPSLRTPRASTFRTPTIRPPAKSTRDEPQYLSLKQVIGTTTSSSNGFDCLESANCFAFLAGAAAVVVTLDDDAQTSQRFFRAKPSANPLNLTTPIYDSPTPLGSSQGPRNRPSASLRDSYIGVQPFGSPSPDALDSPGNKTVARERTKAATCVSFSRDGRFLAVGETGYKPRVLVFSMARDAPADVPLTALSEHIFGVRCVAFSPDSQYLATLGDMNDGFLFIWSINQRNGSATLHASNKCTSNIKQIAWVGQNLLTVGTRHVKIWRIEQKQKISPSKRFSDISFAVASPLKALSGRNCLLGPLLDKTFTAVAALSDDKAIVCSDQGDLCVMDDSEAIPKFTKVGETSFSINAVTIVENTTVAVGGEGGQARHIKIFDILTAVEDDVKATPVDLQTSNRDLVALRSIKSQLIALNDHRQIYIFDASELDSSAVCKAKRQIPAHSGAVLGVQPLLTPASRGAAFLTWSAEGSVLIWNSSGVCKHNIGIPVDQIGQSEEDPDNELKVAKASKNLDYLVTGDKFGILRITDIDSGSCTYHAKAHSAEITDVSILESDEKTLIASSGRDRMVQIFKKTKEGCELQQTLDDHVGAVTGVAWRQDGKGLISCSSDRTVILREGITGELQGRMTTAYLTARTITLKSSPLSMDLSLDSGRTLLLSTTDRQVARYDMRSGSLNSSFKATDNEGGDAVIMNPVVPVSSTSYDSPLIAGVSGTDKSIRLYDDTGRLLGRDYGHTEGMAGVAILSEGSELDKKSLVTAATDGTIFIWSLSTGMDQAQRMLDSLDVSQGTPRANSFFSARPPLRRVLSASELQKFQPRNDREEDDSISPIAEGVNRTLRRKTSRLSMLNTPKLEPSPSRTAPKEPVPEPTHRRLSQSRPSSRPPSRPQSSVGSSSSPPRYQSHTLRHRQSQGGNQGRSRRKSLGTLVNSDEVSGLAAATEHMCRSLHSYRKKLSTSSDVLPLENVRELERELSLTARALAEKAARNETVLAKLLDQYSERLVGMLDEKIAQSVAKQVSRKDSMSEEAVE